MSLKVGDDEEEPLIKKQKCGEDVIGFGGPMDDEATAREKLEKAGFDPDASVDDYDEHGYGTPLIEFCVKGDVSMCRFLLSKGASTTKRSDDAIQYWCPMYAAAYGGSLDVCKLMFANGAGKDIRKINKDGWAPVTEAAALGYDRLLRWMVLHAGALCSDSNSDVIEGDRVLVKPASTKTLQEQKLFTCREEPDVVRSWKRLVEWAEDVLRAHASLVMFLLGTLPPAPGTDQHRTLQSLSGHPGIRKLIGEYAGQEVKKKKHIRILRQVKDVVPSFIKEEEEEEEE